MATTSDPPPPPSPSPRAATLLPRAADSAPWTHIVRGIASQLDTQTTAESAPRATETVPRAAETVPRASESVSRASESVSRASQVVSRAAESVPDASQSVSRALQSVSRATESVPRASELVSRASQLVSRASHSAPRASELVPRATESVPRAADLGPRAAGESASLEIVRGIASELDSESGAVSVEENGGSKKAVWKTPAPLEQVNPLIGVDVWPALGESTKGYPKSSSSDEGSSSVPQLTGMPSVSSSQRQGDNTNTNPGAHTKHTVPTRQRSFRRGNGGGSGNPGNNITTNGDVTLGPPSQGFGLESASNNTGRPVNVESLSEANPHREAGGQRGGFAPRSSTGGEHQQRNSYRRGSGGPHPRGDGSHYHSHGGWRDQDRANQDRVPHRNFGGRGAPLQAQRGSSRPFIRGPPHANTLYAPPPVAVHPSFGTPMVYPSPGPHQDPYRAGPMASPMASPMGPVFYPFFDPLLHTKIINQIEFYFSTENLVRDTYLRKNMDEQGWVSVKLIAGFQKVSQLTDNIQLILAALQASRLLEIEGEKMRLRDDWQRWIIPPLVQQINVSSSQSIQESDQEMLAVQLQNVALDNKSVKM